MACPSDVGVSDPENPVRTRGKRNYYFCAGDSHAHSGNAAQANNPSVPIVVATRGMFGALICYGVRDCTDGTSNTIAMAESVAPSSRNGLGTVSATPNVANPAACAALYNKATRSYPGATFVGDTIRGYRWGDGAAYFSAFSTAVPPNSASCFTGANANSHWFQGIFNASSLHTGGVHALMTDGAVRFISENIDGGNQSAALPAINSSSVSPYGVWGGLGTRAGGEVLGEF